VDTDESDNSFRPRRRTVAEKQQMADDTPVSLLHAQLYPTQANYFSLSIRWLNIARCVIIVRRGIKSADI